MTVETDLNSEPRFLFTAPWEPVVVRRGDALGLRALADEFAEAVAPGLSNRVHDGRWVTILAWCLARSQEAFDAGRHRPVTTASEQRERYAWLQPLELMWVARTIALVGDDAKNRSLSGQRSVAPWYDEYKNNHNGAANRFGMSEEQFRAYRQTGMYGGYRVAFRMWPGLTLNGDGWTPEPRAYKLAKWLDKQLGQRALPTWSLNSIDGTHEKQRVRGPTLGGGDKHDWWLKKWNNFCYEGRNADTNTLPRRKNDFAKLPQKEAELLEPIIFGDDAAGKRRRAIAVELRHSVGTHLDACKHLSNKFSDNPIIAHVARFSRLADAGMNVMDLIARSLTGEVSSSLDDIAASPEAVRDCKELCVAATEWLRGIERESPSAGLSHVERAKEFAKAMTSADPQQCLTALLEYHEQQGGGLRWFVRRDTRVELRSRPTIRTAAPYRFRLWSLCRLAAQCGVIRKMPKAIEGESAESDDGE